ncbi:hypothetical protein C8R45DRAFT_1091190 [Mycena sanguinolenta]|nr:hypothetical protein C8R45DRAFT_1091190 [Mycena sanguinolenta]
MHDATKAAMGMGSCGDVSSTPASSDAYMAILAFSRAAAAELSVQRPPLGTLRNPPNGVWIPAPVPDEQYFEAIKAGIDALPPGATMFLNSGEFYAMDRQTGNLEMLAGFLKNIRPMLRRCSCR